VTKKHDPRAGTCRWVLPIGEVGTGILAINGTNDTSRVSAARTAWPDFRW
jgi:hypothetical protein